MDGAPKVPRRSFCADLGDQDSVMAEALAELPAFRRSSPDGAPSYPRRSCDHLSMEETAKTVQAMFDSMPVLKRKHSDDVPQRPRRSRDSVSLAEDAQTVTDQIAQEEINQADEPAKLTRVDETPKTPRRSRDVADFASIMDELFGTLESKPHGPSGNNNNTQGPKRPNRNSDPSVATTMDSSLNTWMSTSLNSQNRSVDTTAAMIGNLGSKGDFSPKTPIRRRATEDDASTVMTMEKIPEDTTAQLELPSMRMTGRSVDSLVLTSDDGDGTTRDDEDITVTSHADQSYVPDNDDSTLSTLGRRF
jgi:hypothetical protein